MGLSSFTMPANYSGPDYTLTQNQNSSFSEYAKNTSGIINLSGENGGSSANYIIDTATSSTKLEYLQQGVITSDIAFKGTPGLEQVFNALNIRHTAALVNINGKLFDSAANISLFSLKTGTVYGMPWTATCHQSTFNTLMAGGMTAVAAFNKTLSQGSSSYVLSTSLYGINGGFGMSGISNAEIKKKQ
jgi:hypothetical protein